MVKKQHLSPLSQGSEAPVPAALNSLLQVFPIRYFFIFNRTSISAAICSSLGKVHWLPPEQGTWKLNIDGSSTKDLKAGCGGIVRNCFSEMLFAFSEFLGEGSNNMAEMNGLYTGLLMCYQLGIFKILIETDSLLLLHWYQGISSPPWKLWVLWSKISELLLILDVEMVHIYREGNFVADILAKQGSSGLSHQYWFLSELPQAACGAWCSDAMGFPNWRQPH